MPIWCTLPSVIGGPGGCFAFAMPGAYPQDILRAIICEYPRAASPWDLLPSPTARPVQGAASPPVVAPLAKFGTSAVELGGTARGVAGSASERARWPPLGQPRHALCLSHGDGYEDDDALRDAGESNAHSVAGSGP